MNDLNVRGLLDAEEVELEAIWNRCVGVYPSHDEDTERSMRLDLEGRHYVKAVGFNTMNDPLAGNNPRHTIHYFESIHQFFLQLIFRSFQSIFLSLLFHRKNLIDFRRYSPS